MAISSTIIGVMGGDVTYVPLTPNGGGINQVLPAGRWLVQVEATNNNSSSSGDATVAEVKSYLPASSTILITRIVKGGTLTGSTSSRTYFNHGIAIRLGD